MYKYATSIFVALLIPVLTLSCASDQRIIDNRLKGYIQSFEQRYNVYYTGDAVIDKLDKHAGICYTKGSSKRIVISERFYNKYGYNAIEQLMYHELAHCIYFIPHDDTITEGGCPNSIMYSYAFGMKSCYIDNREYYHNQLEGLWKK